MPMLIPPSVLSSRGIRVCQHSSRFIRILDMSFWPFSMGGNPWGAVRPVVFFSPSLWFRCTFRLTLLPCMVLVLCVEYY